MQTKKNEMLSYLVELYKELYSYKNLLKIDFKYSIRDVESFFEQIQDISVTDIDKKPIKEKVSDDILALKTPDDIENYLYSNNQSKDDLVNKLSLCECAYLYNIIYSSPLKSNMRKMDALNTIDKYFKGISRAISMKP